MTYKENTMQTEEFMKLTTEERRAYAVALKQDGAEVYVNEGWHDIQRKDDVTMPGATYWGNRYMTVMPWPSAKVGDVVTDANGVNYEVVANVATAYGPTQQYTCQWAVFARRKI